MVPPKPHRLMKINARSAHFSSVSQAGPAMPIRARPALIRPYSPLNIHFHRVATATPLITLGR